MPRCLVAVLITTELDKKMLQNWKNENHKATVWCKSNFQASTTFKLNSFVTTCSAE